MTLDQTLRIRISTEDLAVLQKAADDNRLPLGTYVRRLMETDLLLPGANIPRTRNKVRNRHLPAVRLSDENYERLKRLAESENISLSEYIRGILLAHMGVGE